MRCEQVAWSTVNGAFYHDTDKPLLELALLAGLLLSAVTDRGREGSPLTPRPLMSRTDDPAVAVQDQGVWSGTQVASLPDGSWPRRRPR